MPSPFFSWDAIDVEIPRKLASLTTPPEDLVTALLGDVETTGADSALAAACRGLLASVDDEADAEYARHALRLAGSLLRVDPDVAEPLLVLAVAHNVDEVSGFEPLGARLDDDQRRALRTLTIDRSRERDAAYLGEYYGGIAASPELLVLKACDKLDNFLSYVIYDIDQYHFDVVVQHVCPRLEGIDARLSTYLRGVVAEVGRPEVKQRYQDVREAMEARS